MGQPSQPVQKAELHYLTPGKPAAEACSHRRAFGFRRAGPDMDEPAPSITFSLQKAGRNDVLQGKMETTFNFIC